MLWILTHTEIYNPPLVVWPRVIIHSIGQKPFNVLAGIVAFHQKLEEPALGHDSHVNKAIAGTCDTFLFGISRTREIMNNTGKLVCIDRLADISLVMGIFRQDSG